jgi:hypothetical protein
LNSISKASQTIDSHRTGEKSAAEAAEQWCCPGIPEPAVRVTASTPPRAQDRRQHSCSSQEEHTSSPASANFTPRARTFTPKKIRVTLAGSNRRARLAGMRTPFESGLLGSVWAPISQYLPPNGSGPPAKNPPTPPLRAPAFLSSSPFLTTSDRDGLLPCDRLILFSHPLRVFELQSIPLPRQPRIHPLPVLSSRYLPFFPARCPLAYSLLP